MTLFCAMLAFRYLEVRFAPQLHINVNVQSGADAKEAAGDGQLHDIIAVLHAVNKGLLKAKEVWLLMLVI